jgi:RNA polymerase sigma-70 factor (sigma-E family)
LDRYEGFREFVLARGPALSRTALLLTGSHHAAEELVQEALVKAAARWRKLTAAGDPEAYLRRTMVNDWISWWRRRRRESVVAAVPEWASTEGAENVAGRLDLAAALVTLAPRQRAVIVLRFYEDLSVEATAALLRCSPGTVKSQTSDALARLRRLVPTLAEEERTVVR